MNDLELEIGRTLGASAFLIYQFVKHNPLTTAKEIQTETGLSECCVINTLAKLRNTKILSHKKMVKKRRLMLYKHNLQENWTLH